MEFRLWLENAEDDQKAVKTAVRVWNKVVRNIEKIPLEVKEITVVRQGKTVPFKGVVFDLGVLFSEFEGMTVFFCGGLGAAASYSKQMNTIFVNLLNRDEPFDHGGSNAKHIARLRIKSWSKEKGSSFIHEFIHYLDAQRYGMAWPENPPKYDNDEVAYFNSPLEFNAFYQELIAKLNNDLKKDHFFRSFDEFMRIVTNKMNEYPLKPHPSLQHMRRDIDGPREKWIKKLNPTYRQKLIRRLYGYYMMRRSKHEGLSSYKSEDSEE